MEMQIIANIAMEPHMVRHTVLLVMPASTDAGVVGNIRETLFFLARY